MKIPAELIASRKIRWRQHMIAACSAISLSVFGCGEPDTCANVTANLVFYENVCVGTWVQCDGEIQPSAEADHGGRFCDLEEITCDEPDRSQQAIRNYAPGLSACELCTEADSVTRCTPLPRGCGIHEIEHVASGSEAEGPQCRERLYGDETNDEDGGA